MRASPRRGARQSGFTLLEVLVAFVIAALALSVLYRGAVDGVFSARTAGQYEDAVSRARSRMAAVGHGSAIVPGEQSGDDGDGFRWRTRVTLVSPAAPSALKRVPALFDVSVAIDWGQTGSNRRLELNSQRLGFVAPPRP